MAVVDFAIEQPPAGHGIPTGTRRVTWTLAGGDTGKPYPCPHYPDKNVSVSGTFDSATVTIQGSDEIIAVPTLYYTLHDQSDNDITFTTARGEQIVNNPYQIRPSVSAGTSTAVVVRLTVTTTARR